MKILLFVFLIYCLHHTQCFERQLQSSLNPGCLSCNSKTITLLYTESIGEQDTIHNVWDFTRGKPTIIFSVTNVNATMNVTWENNLPISFEFSETPKYSFAVVLNKIWEFNDQNNTAVFNPENKSAIREFDMKEMIWNQVNLVEQENEAMVKMTAHEFGTGYNKKKGEISIKLDLFPYTAYAFDLPHLKHSSNTTLIDVIFENMTTTTQFNNSRFCLEMLLVSTEKNNKSNDTININFRMGLDDEHTPGIFEIVEMITPETVKNSDGGFIQYRPVSYTSSLRAVSTSTNVNTGAMSLASIAQNSTAQLFYKEFSDFQLLVENVTICLGGKGDGFYKKSHYSIWSFTMGYGLPPAEGFSLFVILLISIGLGIPFVLMLIGGVYVCLKRRRKLNNQPEILVED